MPANFKLIRELAGLDADALELAEKSYGDSWKQRGGTGAFMMLARKWDRIENQARKDAETPYDIFSAVAAHGINPDGILDDIRDLRRYLLLVEAEMLPRIGGKEVIVEASSLFEGSPTGDYVNQDK